MKTLLHYTDISEPPVGIWWEDEAGGEARSYYLEGREAEKMVGSQIMSKKVASASWPVYFDFLERSNPTLNGWETAEVNDPPDHFLKLLQRLRQSA